MIFFWLRSADQKIMQQKYKKTDFVNKFAERFFLPIENDSGRGCPSLLRLVCWHVVIGMHMPLLLTTTAVSCPTNSNGTDVPSGCTCNAGYNGVVTATTTAPYYTSTCAGMLFWGGHSFLERGLVEGTLFCVAADRWYNVSFAWTQHYIDGIAETEQVQAAGNVRACMKRTQSQGVQRLIRSSLLMVGYVNWHLVGQRHVQRVADTPLSHVARVGEACNHALVIGTPRPGIQIVALGCIGS